MIRSVVAVVCCLLANVGFAQTIGPSNFPPSEVMVYGNGRADHAMPPWSITAPKPDGWTADCCGYAKNLHVNLVMYAGQWTGKPERVMILTTWPANAQLLDDVLKSDQEDYLKKNPAGKVVPFPIANKGGLTCRGQMYAGLEGKLDDFVVFCQPQDKSSGLQLSWSMQLAGDDPSRQQILAWFKQVVEGSSYAPYVPVQGQ